MGIMFAIGAPMFTEFQNSSRLRSSAQILETTFGEAFSSARSRPECFVINGNKGTFSLISYDKKNCENLDNPKISRDFKLNPGVKFEKEFSVKFKPPFGDLEFLNTENKELEELEIKLCNTECVSFIIYQKSGLVTRLPKDKKEDIQIVNQELE